MDNKICPKILLIVLTGFNLWYWLNVYFLICRSGSSFNYSMINVATFLCIVYPRWGMDATSAPVLILTKHRPETQKFILLVIFLKLQKSDVFFQSVCLVVWATGSSSHATTTKPFYFFPLRPYVGRKNGQYGIRNSWEVGSSKTWQVKSNKLL